MLTTHAMKDKDVIFGDFSKVFIGAFGALEIMPRAIGGGNIEIEAFLEVDLKLALEKAFVGSKVSA